MVAVCDFVMTLTCMWRGSSGCSPIRPSVMMWRFPASLEVWEDREDDEWRIEPWRFRGLQGGGNGEEMKHMHYIHVTESTGSCGRCEEERPADGPVSVYEAHTLRAHVAVGGEDASGRVHPLAPGGGESIHGGHALLRTDHILLWIFTPITSAFNPG